MSYEDAVDLFSQIVDFLPGSAVTRKPTQPDKRASCNSAEAPSFAIQWPTQAITID
jgi:hypothetical protein